MTKFAVFNDGFPAAFYDESIHGSKRRPVYGEPDEETGEREVIGDEINPDCLIPPEAIEITDQQWMELLNHPGRRRWLDGAVVAYYPPEPPLTQADYSAAIQAHMDAKARERQYDGIQTAITYRDDPNPQFAAEGEALFAWRSAVWTYSTAELQKVMTGLREQPTVETFITELPAFIWPVSGA